LLELPLELLRHRLDQVGAAVERGRRVLGQDDLPAATDARGDKRLVCIRLRRIVADVASDHVVGDERVELPSDALMLHVDAAAELVAMPSSPNDTENASAFWLFQPSWTSP